MYHKCKYFNIVNCEQQDITKEAPRIRDIHSAVAVYAVYYIATFCLCQLHFFIFLPDFGKFYYFDRGILIFE